MGHLALLLVAIGMSSFYYHASLTFVGQFFDIFSMYVFGTLLIVAALIRRGQLTRQAGLKVFLASNAILAVVQYSYPDARRLLFAALLLPGVVMEFGRRTSHAEDSRKLWPLYAGFGLLVVAYCLWLADQTRVLCSPSSWLQGHAAWHTLTAVSIGLLALHYERTAHVEVSK
jgi:hypothetical protein